jgi:hypothetical protein
MSPAFTSSALTVVIYPTGFSANKTKMIKLGMAVKILAIIAYSAAF